MALSLIMKVTISTYDPNWPKQYQREANRITPAFQQNLIRLHHVGSTAVPGLAAKPTIDMIAEVKDFQFQHDPLFELGYIFKGAYNLPFRKSFSLRTGELKINLHVFEVDDPEIELNLKFRNYLRANDKIRDEYSALKYALVQLEDSHKKNNAMYRGYTLGKQKLIHKILRATGFNRTRMVLCAHHEEWETVKKFRQQYFFDKVPIDDPYTWTFEHQQHKHFILYQGVTIVGYAHIQLWPENRAAMRIIVVEKSVRNHGLGNQFMQLVEKWLRMESYTSIHAESTPAAYNFYQACGYTNMLFNDPDGYEGGEEDISVGKRLN